MNSEKPVVNLAMKALLLGLFSVSVAGAQTRSFMMIFLTLDPDRPVLSQSTIDSLQFEHMQNIQKLANEGKLLMAGPFDSGGGIFVLSTGSKDTATMWLATDPAVRSKRWTIEIYPYVPTIGSICQVAVKYEMVTYSFVRFEWTQGNGNQFAKLVDRESIVGAGVLLGSGSIVVARGEVKETALRSSHIIQESKVSVSVKKLWIAKGSFCED